MYLKATKGTPAFKVLMDIQLKMRAARKAANALNKNIKGSGDYLGRPMVAAGGISGIIFDSKPDGYKQVWHNHYPNAFFPKKIKANAALLKKNTGLASCYYTRNSTGD